MPLRLDARDAGFAQAFADLVNARREADEDVSAVVREIIATVKAKGDDAVADYTQRFDRHDLDAIGWQVSKQARADAFAGLDPKLRAALELAAERITTYHAAQKPADSERVDSAGVRMGASRSLRSRYRNR